MAQLSSERGRMESFVANSAQQSQGKWAVLPDEFSAAGLMVPEPSMMPLPMPPFARAETGCDMEEYMPVRSPAERADGAGQRPARSGSEQEGWRSGARSRRRARSNGEQK